MTPLRDEAINLRQLRLLCMVAFLLVLAMANGWLDRWLDSRRAPSSVAPPNAVPTSVQGVRV